LLDARLLDARLLDAWLLDAWTLGVVFPLYRPLTLLRLSLRGLPYHIHLPLRPRAFRLLRLSLLARLVIPLLPGVALLQCLAPLILIRLPFTVLAHSRRNGARIPDRRLRGRRRSGDRSLDTRRAIRPIGNGHASTGVVVAMRSVVT
jgi:hypothetical protein